MQFFHASCFRTGRPYCGARPISAARTRCEEAMRYREPSTRCRGCRPGVARGKSPAGRLPAPPHPTGPVDTVRADRSCVTPRFASLRPPTTGPPSPVGRGPCSPRYLARVGEARRTGHSPAHPIGGAERDRRQTHHDHHREDHHQRDPVRTRRHGPGRVRPGRPAHLDHRDERARPHRPGPSVPGLDPHPPRAPTRPSLPRHRREPGRARWTARRTLAAIETGPATIPVYISGGKGSEPDRIFAQIDENDRYRSLSDTDRATAFHQLTVLGVTAAQIAKHAHTQTRRRGRRPDRDRLTPSRSRPRRP